MAALKSPLGGNLDRIQVIKGWLDAAGKTHEKIFDVAWGDASRRKITNGKLTPVGNTVDVAKATWTNTIGDPELITVWRDTCACSRFPRRAGPRTTRPTSM